MPLCYPNLGNRSDSHHPQYVHLWVTILTSLQTNPLATSVADALCVSAVHPVCVDHH